MKNQLEEKNTEIKNKKQTFRRVLAYIIDLVIVTYISGLFASIEFLNPNIEQYNNVYEEYTQMLNDPELSSELLNSDKLMDITYDLSYYGAITSFITIGVTILYFVVFQYFNKGKTIGKAILKIKVVNEDNKKPHFIQFLLRSIIINSLVTNLLSNTLVLVVSKEVFKNVNTYIQFIDIGLLLTTFSMMLLREDGRGLHDLFAKTNVISSKRIVENNEVKEAIIEEKKEEPSKNEKTKTVKTTKTTRKKVSKNENSNRK